ncbi:putative FMN hydrolase [Photobacterium aphoticum]|uniref:Putative FMN hydrolase n=1 Tax=Photobacterium aphoticum TaxID=754436 RepID=A0A090QY06_9GAMM|nr:putative FMN hydrolase [Photobacterium aphoticum]
MQVYRPFPAPKAITFDLDDTLYDNRPVIRRAEQAMYDWLASEHL